MLQEIEEDSVLVAPQPKKGRTAFGRMYGVVSPGYKEDDLPIDMYLLLFGDALERVKKLDPAVGDILRVSGVLYYVKKQDADGEEVQYMQIIPDSVEFSPCADANLCFLVAEGIVSDSKDKEVLKVYEDGKFCRFTIGTIPPSKNDENWINVKCLSFNTDRVKKMKLKKGSNVRVYGNFFRRVFEGQNGDVFYNEVIVSQLEYFKRKSDEGKKGNQKVRDAEEGDVPGVE